MESFLIYNRIDMATVRLSNAEAGPGSLIKYPPSLSGNPDLPVTYEQLANLTGMSGSGSGVIYADHR